MYSLRNRAVAACAIVWLSAANAVAGEHTDEALRNWGFSAAEIQALREAKAIA